MCSIKTPLDTHEIHLTNLLFLLIQIDFPFALLAMFNIFDKPGHTKYGLSAAYATPSRNFTAPRNGYFLCSDLFISHTSRLNPPKILIDPDTSLTLGPKVDLELRLGQPRPSVNKVGGTGIVSGTNQTSEVPDDLMLTLGNKTLGQDNITKGRLPLIKGVQPGTQVQPPAPEIQVFASSSHEKYRKRDYYGPCVKCGKVFDTSQSYAGHMAAHYKMEETIEERIARRAKKRKHQNLKLRL